MPQSRQLATIMFSVEFTFKWAFRNLHSNPRYQKLIRQIGLGGS